MEALGSFLEPLGTHLGDLEGSETLYLGDLGGCWTHLGVSWSALGGSWKGLGRSWKGLGRLLGGSWEHFGGIWEVFWSYVWSLGSVFGAICRNIEKPLKTP